MFTCFVWVTLLVYHSTWERVKAANQPREWNFPTKQGCQIFIFYNLLVLILDLFFLPVILPSEILRLATDPLERVFPGVLKLLSFLRLLSLAGSPSLPLLSLFLSFIFCPTSFWRQWAAFMGAWCPLPAFRSCSVEFARLSNVLSMNLWGRKWSPRPIPLPSQDRPLQFSWREL